MMFFFEATGPGFSCIGVMEVVVFFKGWSGESVFGCLGCLFGIMFFLCVFVGVLWASLVWFLC